MSKFQGAGEISIAKLNSTTGFPTTPFRFLGCVDQFDPKFNVTLGAEHIERCTGLGQIDYQGVKLRSGTLDLSFTEWNIKNIAMMLNGTVVDAGAPGTVTSESLPTMAVGDVWHLGAGSGTTHQNITGLTLNSTGSPGVALVLNTHYSLDAAFGTIKILSLAGVAQPIVAAYGYTDAQAAVIFTASDDSYIVRFNSLNVANSLSKGIVELYSAKINPVGSMPLIGDDFITFALTMRLFADQNRASDATYGQFGRVIQTI